jgi:hypothetical protein
MALPITCFVSFSATDGNEGDVRFLIDYLSARLGEKVDFKAYFQMRSGASLQDFMRDDLLKSEAVLALFTPDYKLKADQNLQSGVSTEFRHIVSRLEGKQGGPLILIPAYWNGATFEAAVPKYFQNENLTRNLFDFHDYGSGEVPFLPQRIERGLRTTINMIVEELEIRWMEAQPDHQLAQTKIDNAMSSTVADGDQKSSENEHQTRDADTVLFAKAERTLIPLHEFNKLLFVKTAAFRSLHDYHRMAFTGRKGSGKTTLLKIYKFQNEGKYFSPIDIEVNDWNLHYILGDLTFRPREGDLSYTEEESRIFDFVWPTFLALCLVRSVRDTNPGTRLDHLIPSRNLGERFRVCERRYDALFMFAIEVVTAFIQSCIDRASNNNETEFRSDLLQSLNVQACTEFLLGHGFRGLRQAIEADTHQRRFLFCLDRFDTEIQKYRKDLKERNVAAVDRARRELREVHWIQGLVEMIDHLRRPDNFSLNQSFYKTIGPWVDFCVPLPRDRLYEVQLRRRDSIVGEIDEEIRWQPKELLTMLRKRMQVVWGIGDEQLDRSVFRNARKRYDRVLEMSGRKIPNMINVTINGAKFPIDLFLNVLRHTFFRPRDINIYYARILSAVEAAHKRNEEVSPQVMGRLISEQTYRVVVHEFLGEFSDTFLNIRDVVHLFRASPQLLNLGELEARLVDVRFRMYGGEDIVELGAKIRFLYEIGFLGVSSSVGQLGYISQDDYDFYFVKPRLAAALEQPAVLEACKFALHPVFIEYLTLRLNGTKPVMSLDWDIVETMDTFN